MDSLLVVKCPHSKFMSHKARYLNPSCPSLSTGCLCLLLLTLVFASAVRAGEPPNHSYSDPTFGFSINYPNNWRAESGRLPDSKLRVTPGVPGIACYVKIISSERFPNTTPESAAATMHSESGKWEAMMQKMVAGFQLFESSRIRINQVSYWKTSAQFDTPVFEKTRNVEIRTASRGNLYNVACVAPLAEFGTYEAAFDNIIGSFHLNLSN